MRMKPPFLAPKIVEMITAGKQPPDLPHGTTVVAEGTSSATSGKPTIPAVDITPFATAPPNNKITFPS
jgi:hypothetical protein